MKVKISALLLLSSLSCFARVVQFVPGDFNTFVTQSLEPHDQERFKGYYATLQEQIELETNDKQKKTREYLYNRGFASLERDKRSWHTQLVEFLGPDYLDVSYDAERNQVREFVYWQGALEEFKQAKQTTAQVQDVALEEVKEKTGFLSNAKSYMAKASQKVGNWFKGLRSSL